jgi:hypothetical protein
LLKPFISDCPIIDLVLVLSLRQRLALIFFDPQLIA